MPVQVGVVHVDRTGYRVVGAIDSPNDRAVADSILLLAKAAVAAARALRRPVGTVKVDWPGGSLVVKVRDGEVVGVVVEEYEEAPGLVGGPTTATAQAGP